MTEAGWIYHSRVTIWKDPVVEMQRTKALGLLYKQLRKNAAMSRQGMPDYVLTFRKPGECAEPVTHTHQSFPLEQWQKWASPVWMDIDQTDVLNYQQARAEQDERHICPLQLGVIERCIRLWSNPGDLILSPFAGIGSEGYVALEQKRRFVGIELKQEYVDVAVRYLRQAGDNAQINLFSE
jgi:DNA modification methylase